MVEIAAAAELRHGTDPVDAVGRTLQQLCDLARCPGLSHLFDTDLAPLAGDGIGHEHRAPLHLGNAQTFCGIIGDHRFINLIFKQHKKNPSVKKRHTAGVPLSKQIIVF